MQVYLLRHIETKEFQGVFWAENVMGLWDTFDEVGTPADCEFALLETQGGIYSNMPFGEGMKIPQLSDPTREKELEIDVNFDKFEPSELLSEALISQDQLEWIQMPSFREFALSQGIRFQKNGPTSLQPTET